MFAVTEYEDSSELPFAFLRNQPPEFGKVIQKYKNLFSSVGTGINGFTATLKLKPDAVPVFQKSRPFLYSLVEPVEKEYDRLIAADILFPMSHGDWASPTVHVPKAQGSVRVCGDYKRVNEMIEDDQYKIPNVQDMFAKLGQNGTRPKVYSVLDLAGAFNQLLLDQESAKL